MSFRTYAPNPTLQRLRLMNADGLKQLFTPTPIEDYIPFYSDSSHDAYEQHTISGYGDLTAPHSFTVTTHQTKRLRRCRRSSTVRQLELAATPHGEHSPQADQILRTEQKTDEKSVELTIEGSDPAESSSSTLQVPSTSGKGSGSNSEVILTGRPVFVPDDDPTEDLKTAVILKAKWEKLSRATPRKVLLPRKAT